MSSKKAQATLLAALLALAGCEQHGSVATIHETRTVARPTHPVKLDATTAERFEMSDHMGPGGDGPPIARPRKKPLAWTLPAGWTERPDPQNMRVGSFNVAGNPDADCSIVLLPGQAGGLEANVNRWRHQMGAGELTIDAIAKLPTRPLLGGPAAIVDVDGAYAGMGGAPAKEGYKLLGAIRQFSVGDTNAMVFVKMVGPKTIVEAERASFDALCDSIRIATNETPREDPSTEPEPPKETPPLEWSAPPDWKKLPEKPMRLVSFGVREQTECYLSVLPGPAGGLESNLNRWRKQMGQPPLDEAGIGALPRVRVLGQDVPLIEAQGNFTDMQGDPHAGWAMLGAIATKGDFTVFVKMVGPDAEVHAERERFLAFASSLK